MVLGFAQMDFADSIAYLNVIPNFTMTIEAARFIKLVILTKGYVKFDKARGTMASEF